MDMSAFFCVVLSCVGSGLATGWSPVQGVLPNAQNRFISFISQSLNWKMPEGLIRIYFTYDRRIRYYTTNQRWINEGSLQ
jgi:hypothetical protein